MDKNKVIAIYVDMRNSTKIDDDKVKWDSYNEFYKLFKSIKTKEGGYKISRAYPAGDGILLVSKCKLLETKKLNDLFVEVQDKINLFHKKTNQKVGVGASYGYSMDIQVESMSGESEVETVGTPLDLAAKGSNNGNKNSDFIWFISNNKSVKKLPNHENQKLINKLKECEKISEYKESSSGNFRFNF
ncbi:hypothetical protein [Mycoplasma marinum]|uniref:Uncharacterized protein n=1 Tax=Mycoplasma marinum TaxID=1937190 RepID=A0A4R0XIJ3_9MOLU|nr:hypothetical protein [Mycoplasma marinum]TCG10396.1 hypothetical protein C4B24_04685 [Mycoplasma marinum]